MTKQWAELKRRYAVHDDLVAALRTIRDITSPGLAAASKFTDMDPRERLADIYAKARAALAQVEAER